MTLEESIATRGVTRLCHFTPSRNLAHIIADGRGIVASRSLSTEARAIFNPTDLKRLDGHQHCVCCSVEYPNAWYFRTARGKEPIFKDWVVLIISADALRLPDVKFCKRNAAAGYGQHVRAGKQGFDAMYVSDVAGAGGTYRRSSSHHPAVPTDQQAEVLIPDLVPLAMIMGVAVSSKDQAILEIERLKLASLPVPRFVIAPHFYRAKDLSRAILAGSVPPEEPYDVASEE